MSASSIVTRGYGKGVRFISPRGYLASIAPTPTPADTHDGFPKRLHLPIYEFTKKKILPKKEIIYQPEESAPIVIPRQLATYDIDWRQIELNALQANIKLNDMIAMLEQLRVLHEMALQREEEDFMLLTLAASIH